MRVQSGGNFPIGEAYDSEVVQDFNRNRTDRGDFVPVFTGTTLTNCTTKAKYLRIEGLVHFHISVVVGGSIGSGLSSSSGTSYVQLPLPATFVGHCFMNSIANVDHSFVSFDIGYVDTFGRAWLPAASVGASHQVVITGYYFI